MRIVSQPTYTVELDLTDTITDEDVVEFREAFSLGTDNLDATGTDDEPTITITADLDTIHALATQLHDEALITTPEFDAVTSI